MNRPFKDEKIDVVQLISIDYNETFYKKCKVDLLNKKQIMMIADLLADKMFEPFMLADFPVQRY